MDEPTLTLADGLRLTGLSDTELEFRYLTLGGAGSLVELRRHLDGRFVPDEHEHNVIAQALNEALLERGRASAVGYRDLFRLAAPPVDVG